MTRKLNRNYVWTRDDGFTQELGKLLSIEPSGNLSILVFDSGLKIPDERRISEVKKPFFGGNRG